MILAAVLLSGCGGAVTSGSAGSTATPGYSESAPAKLLDAPDRARDAAAAASDRANAEQEAVPK